MRVEVKGVIPKRAPEYPKLRAYADHDNLADQGKFIVLFKGPRHGQVVWSDNRKHPVGEYRADWCQDNFIDTAQEVFLTED